MADDIQNTTITEDTTATADDTAQTLAQKLGAEIERRRKEKGLSRRELAALIGVNEISFGAYATGTRLPSVDKILMIARALDCSITDLVGDNPARNTASKIWERRVQRCVNIANWAQYYVLDVKEGKVVFAEPSKIILTGNDELVEDHSQGRVITATEQAFVSIFEEIAKIALAGSDLRQIADDYFRRVK